ncbi:putative MarR family transcriptional regulator [Kitasatospora setae KM-6054]|uniref:Putative MarR family transcriptional regulator n=2 Tax=Streptomycetaceae TaxID=2062 RepID=E4N1D5_KITSK|nr:MarR family transcriptional regulator [Kitasatospora sp. SID7827]BAJ31969.1 putative MarR family transcriptional regulator [Kitasatospora setae KM-6054]
MGTWETNDSAEQPALRALLKAVTGLVGPLLERTGEIFAAHKVPFSQAGLLAELHERGGPQRMVTLAQLHGVAPRTMTSLVEGLEKRGLVDRTTDPADRRVTLVTVSTRGQALMRRIEEARDAFAAEIFSPLSAADRSALLALLGKAGPVVRGA